MTIIDFLQWGIQVAESAGQQKPEIVIPPIDVWNLLFGVVEQVWHTLISMGWKGYAVIVLFVVALFIPSAKNARARRRRDTAETSTGKSQVKSQDVKDEIFDIVKNNWECLTTDEKLQMAQFTNAKAQARKTNKTQFGE
jgi:hypothetical protein